MIRYDAKLRSELQKATRNFNAKVRRLERQGKKYLPDRVNAREIRANITTRRQLYSEINKLKAFSVRGAEKIVENQAGVKFTAYEYKRLLSEQATTRRRLQKLIKNNEMIEQISSKYPVIKSARTRELKSQLNALNSRSVQTANYRQMKTVKKQIYRNIHATNYNQIFYNNFFEILQNISFYGDVPLEDLENIEEKLRNLSPSQLVDAFYNEPSLQSMVFVYNTKFHNPDGSRKKISGRDMKGMEVERNNVTELYDDLYSYVDEVIDKYGAS